MFSTDRQTYRRIFLEAWSKASNAAPLEPLEAQIVEVMRQHPEYHRLLQQGEETLDQDFRGAQGQTNPFLHMGLHLAVIEQLNLDQPRGIRQRYRALSERMGDSHAVEHRIMDCLMEALWRAQQNQQSVDEPLYLDCIEHHLKS